MISIFELVNRNSVIPPGLTEQQLWPFSGDDVLVFVSSHELAPKRT
jgi:hypothetical protein